MILGLISNERVSFHIICVPSRVNCRWGCIPHRSVGSLIVHITPQNTHPPQKRHSSVKHQWRYRPSPSDQLMLAQTLFSGLDTTQWEVDGWRKNGWMVEVAAQNSWQLKVTAYASCQIHSCPRKICFIEIPINQSNFLLEGNHNPAVLRYCRWQQEVISCK